MADLKNSKVCSGHTRAPGQVERWLLDEAGLTPRSAVKRAFAEKRVLLNGRPAARHDEASAGDLIEVLMGDGVRDLFTEAELLVAPNPELPLKVAVENRDLFVVNKPAGQSAFPLRPNDLETTLNAIAARDPLAVKPMRQGKPLEGGLVHRIDRGTSGLLACARSLPSLERLSAIWRGREVEKVYLAWVHGFVEKPALLELTLDHDEKSSKRMAVARAGLKGWPARTSFLPARTVTLANGEPATLLVVRIHTGVMHQIRASLAWLGHPVVGDLVYPHSTFGRARLALATHAKPLPADDAAVLEPLKVKLAAEVKGEPMPEKLPERGFFLHAWFLRVAAEPSLKDGLFAPVPGYFGSGG